MSVYHPCRIALKHLDSNGTNAPEISFHAFYRKEFKTVLDKLDGLIIDHLEKAIMVLNYYTICLNHQL